MSNADDNDSDQSRVHSEARTRDVATRDDQGRWLPGHCPNPKGRPKNGTKSKVHVDPSDLFHFRRAKVEFIFNGEKQTTDRETALWLKMYADAMNGKVSNQRYILNEFKKNKEKLAELRILYETRIFDWYIDNPKINTPGYKVPAEKELEIAKLRAVLNHYDPESYPDPAPSLADDDEANDS